MKEISGRIQAYIAGFILSLVMTLLAYWLVSMHVLSSNTIIPLILLIAFMQLFFQLIFFLHLGRGSVWHAGFFIATFIAVLVIVVASIWIMGHLNYNMTPQQMNQYIQNQSGF